MAASPDAATKLWWRNALVEQNLALVRMVAQRQSQRTTSSPMARAAAAVGMAFLSECSVQKAPA